MFDTILVGTDGSEGATVAVEHATELARLLGATLHVVSVAKPMPRSATAGTPRDDLTEDARQALNRAAEWARASGVRVETHAVMGLPHTCSSSRPRNCRQTSSWWETAGCSGLAASWAACPTQ